MGLGIGLERPHSQPMQFCRRWVFRQADRAAQRYPHQSMPAESA
jgi:hypothetical protein